MINMQRAYLFLLCSLAACHTKPATLSDAVVESREGLVKAHVPVGWRCEQNDLDKEHFQQRGVKCVDDAGVLIYAKILDVDTNDARNVTLMCMQDWKQEYSKIFTGVQKYTHDVVDFRGTPSCKVVIDGASPKGAWHMMDLHAPNGRRILQITVSGFMPEFQKQQRAIDDWIADLQYNLAVPGQSK